MPSLGFQKLLNNARKLVPFLTPGPISPRMAKEQDTPLLSWLPPELRRLIWETYFRGHAVHLYLEGRLRTKECLEQYADDASPGPHFGLCSTANKQCDHLSLLLTCKMIYFECIRILYQETCFDFSHGVRSVIVMSERLPATHFAHISRVNITWTLYHPLRLMSKKPGKYEILWVGIWKALAAMQGLEWLRVELVLGRPVEAWEWPEVEWTLWEGIKKVTRPSHFELILPFPAAVSMRDEILPCTVIRRIVDVRQRLIDSGHGAAIGSY